MTYHSACSLQHGQRVTEEPKALLRTAGFKVAEAAEPHLCCGSAGTYNLLQPEIAGRLRERKLGNIARTGPDVIAAGNIGCITQLSGRRAGRAHGAVARLDDRRAETARARLKRLLVLLLLAGPARPDRSTDDLERGQSCRGVEGGAQRSRRRGAGGADPRVMGARRQPGRAAAARARGAGAVGGRAGRRAGQLRRRARPRRPTCSMAGAAAPSPGARWATTPAPSATSRNCSGGSPTASSLSRTSPALAEARGDWKGALVAWQKLLELDPQTPGGQTRLRDLKRRALGRAVIDEEGVRFERELGAARLESPAG